MKSMPFGLCMALATLPLNAQGPSIEDFPGAPMVVTAEQRARITKEFFDLAAQKAVIEERLYNCQSAHLVGWREWW